LEPSSAGDVLLPAATAAPFKITAGQRCCLAFFVPLAIIPNNNRVIWPPGRWLAVPDAD